MTTVRQRLASLGTELGQFNQGEFRGAWTRVSGATLTGGYCAGVCLDWARRVLQNRPDQDDDRPNRVQDRTTYKSPKNTEDRNFQTLQRMAVAYGGQGASYVNTTRQTSALQAINTLLAQDEERVRVNGRIENGVPVSSDDAALILRSITPNPNPFNVRMQTAAWVPHATLTFWKNHLLARTDPQHRSLADGGRHWQTYAAELDAEFGSIRQTAGRQISRKGFANLTVVSSSNQQTYAAPSNWRGTLERDGFQEGCCTVIGMGAPGHTGHAVAVHMIGGEYQFFDPNYGAYRYTMQNLMRALQHLFGVPYWADDGGIDQHLPVYRRRATLASPAEPVWSQMSYTIFRRA